MGLVFERAAVAVGDPSMPWVGPLVAVATIILGGGGFAALLRVRHDKRLGVAQQETAEEDALSSRWRAIIETQTKVLLEPMQAQIAELKVEVTQVKVELSDSKRKYRGAIGYIRTLHQWINQHLPESVEQVPPPPAVLAEDI